MVVHTCNPSYLGGWNRRITWTREAEFAVSQDHTIVPQPGGQERNSISKKWKEKKRKAKPKNLNRQKNQSQCFFFVMNYLAHTCPGSIPYSVFTFFFNCSLGSGAHVHILHPSGLLHRYIHAMVVCCLYPPCPSLCFKRICYGLQLHSLLNAENWMLLIMQITILVCNKTLMNLETKAPTPSILIPSNNYQPCRCYTQKNKTTTKKEGPVWWLTPVIPALWEA